MTFSITKHINWVPSVFGKDGNEWVGYWDGKVRGRVRRICEGRYEATMYGRRSVYGGSMRYVAKHVVCHVNNVWPGQVK